MENKFQTFGYGGKSCLASHISHMVWLSSHFSAVCVVWLWSRAVDSSLLLLALAAAVAAVLQ